MIEESNIELEIKWDGEVSGLDEHRLSIGSFAMPLYHLLAAIRRKASNIVRISRNQEPLASGPFAEEAKRIDLEVQGLLASSSGIHGLVRMNEPEVGNQLTMPFRDLPMDATARTLEDIERVRSGEAADQSVKKYLGSLPSGVSSQEYKLSRGGEVHQQIAFGGVSVSMDTTTLPCLSETVGKVIGVGFEPGSNWVRIKCEVGNVTMQSDLSGVNRAIEMRNDDVRVLFVGHEGSKRRLLRMDDPGRPRAKIDDEDYVFKKWKSVLDALAE